MQKIKLKDGTVLECEKVSGNTMLYLGVSRDALTFSFDPETISLDTVLTAFSPDNCAAITITDETGAAFVHEHYTIRTAAGIGRGDPARTGFAGGPVENDTESVWVTLAQSTPTERMLEALMGGVGVGG